MSETTEDGPSFAMLTCANGAEQCVKDAIAPLGWRLAFSRPGFVTCKHDHAAAPPYDTFIRTSSYSIGQVRGVEGQALLAQLMTLLEAHSQEPFDQLHVWPRDRLPIGKFGFEPGLDEVSKVVADELHAVTHPRFVTAAAPNQIAQPGERVLDVVLVDPSHWFVGWHQAEAWETRWAGGVQPLEPDEEPISRAYYKAAESIDWSGFEMNPGDTVVEVGSAPGGACGRFLELGFNVIAVDPAEMDESIAEHPRLKHFRARAGDLPRKEFTGAKWLFVDSNVKPDKTLTTVHHIVTHTHCTIEGMLLTMKLGDYKAAAEIPDWVKRAERWKPRDIRIRQLARNRCEVCFAVRLR
ncbi:MAG: SAM-dependent methyltransferase [Planctomycetota bacterium]